MKVIEAVSVAQIQGHLKSRGSGVGLDLSGMPGKATEYEFVRADLEEADVDRIFCWFEFGVHTHGGTAKLTDALPVATENKRIKSFIEGDPAKRRGPLDLRMASGMEPVLVSNDLQHGLLVGIDGNHRMMAQFLSGKSFAGVPVFVAVHPELHRWAYVPQAGKAWDAARQSA